MKNGFSATPTQKKADRYDRAAKGQIRTKAEKRGYRKAKEEDSRLITKLKILLYLEQKSKRYVSLGDTSHRKASGEK